MRILGLSGSLRRDSHNTRLLRGLAAVLPAGVELERFERLAEIPPYSEDEEHRTPPSVAALKEAIASADAVIVATPEYNASIPGVLKNALDWVSRPAAQTPLRGKPVLVVGASTGMFGAVWAQADLRRVLSTIGARVLDRELPIARAHETLDRDGLPEDREARETLESMVVELVELARPDRVIAA